MERTYLRELNASYADYDGKSVTVAGWAKTIRDSKAFGFIELNDGSCFKNTQIVFERATLDNYDEIAKENVGCALIVKGRVVVTTAGAAKTLVSFPFQKIPVSPRKNSRKPGPWRGKKE